MSVFDDTGFPLNVLTAGSTRLIVLVNTFVGAKVGAFSPDLHLVIISF